MKMAQCNLNEEKPPHLMGVLESGVWDLGSPYPVPDTQIMRKITTYLKISFRVWGREPHLKNRN